MRSRFLMGAILAGLLAFVSVPAQAWNKSGHMVSGAIAYYELRERDPQALQTVVSLLKQHPYYEAEWAKQLNATFVPSQERDLYLFMLAARWADDIRNDRTYHRAKWHYINFPYVAPNAPAQNLRDPHEGENVLKALEENRAIVKSSAAPAEKAVALCWLFHLTGDVHQPLHAVTLISTLYPKGDLGGNRFFIRAREGAKTITLHKFWDDLVLGSTRFTDTRNRAIELRKEANLQRNRLDEIKEKRFSVWAEKESAELAKRVAYLAGNLAASDDEKNGTLLPSDYAANAKKVAERRMVLAGYRLADLLQEDL